MLERLIRSAEKTPGEDWKIDCFFRICGSLKIRNKVRFGMANYTDLRNVFELGKSPFPLVPWWGKSQLTSTQPGSFSSSSQRAHNAKKKRNAKNAPDPSAAFFSFKGAKTPEEGATLGNRLFAAAANVGDALSDMVARAAGPLAEEPLGNGSNR